MSLWGSLESRFDKSIVPHKLLALDGGGIRGVITLEVLVKMEALLAKALGKGPEFRLADYFDYIAGTSTGAIIAAGLARGLSAAELLDFYRKTGPAMFDKAFVLQRLRNLYDHKALAEELQKTFGKDADLSLKYLKCLVLIVTRNVTTDSPWPISSNPYAKYNDLKRADCNLCIPLWQLVRASTAAPIFFSPEVLQWDKNDPSKTFVFEDGGITPYNNPAFLLFRMATHPAYQLGWKTGEKNLLLISIGTGSAPTTDADVYSPGKNIFGNLTGLPSAFMYGAQVDQDINCRTIGRCVYGAPIDREVDDMMARYETEGGLKDVPLSQDLGRAFLYARYNADMSFDGLKKWGFNDINPGKIGRMDSVENINDLSRIGRRLAEEVRIEHFGPFV